MSQSGTVLSKCHNSIVILPFEQGFIKIKTLVVGVIKSGFWIMLFGTNRKIKILWHLSHTTTSRWYGRSLCYSNFSCNFPFSPTSFHLLIPFYCRYHKTHDWSVHQLIVFCKKLLLRSWMESMHSNMY